ncbi:MAG: hypothetical protein KAI41_08855 [Hyphomicrobiaceae bacterium]|nr:hypothetical protein [Hyphomicrobiaceae bacterium]
MSRKKDGGGPYGGFPPYVKGSDTSLIAAHLIADETLTLRAKVYLWIYRQGERGATDDEIERALEMRHQTASARRRELVLQGRIEDSERRRPTSSGRPAAIWVALPPEPEQREMFR